MLKVENDFLSYLPGLTLTGRSINLVADAGTDPAAPRKVVMKEDESFE